MTNIEKIINEEIKWLQKEIKFLESQEKLFDKEGDEAYKKEADARHKKYLLEKKLDLLQNKEMKNYLMELLSENRGTE